MYELRKLDFFWSQGFLMLGRRGNTNKARESGERDGSWRHGPPAVIQR